MFEQEKKALNPDRKPSLLKLVRYPNKLLNHPSLLVTSSIIDDVELQELLQDMEYTLTHYRATGLAAVQVGVNVQVLLIQDQFKQPWKIINPVIKSVNGSQYEVESCLSVPGVATRMTRPSEITVQFMNEHGELKTETFTGLLARALAHELEHIQGIVYLDKLSKVQRDGLVRKYQIFMKQFKKVDGYADAFI